MGAAHEPPRPPRRPTTPDDARARDRGVVTLRTSRAMVRDAMRCDAMRRATGDGRWDG